MLMVIVLNEWEIKKIIHENNKYVIPAIEGVLSKDTPVQ